ncbi:MAG: carbon storage regulator [Huintestinicola sp.]
MLIISRKQGESFLIGEDIRISIIEASKDKVRVGIDAPRDVKIIRSELYESERFNMQAAVNKVSVDFMNSFFTGTPNPLNNIGGSEKK